MTRVVAISAGSDYTVYLEAESVEEAYWEGRGAELLQLEWQRVRSEQVNQLAKCIDPNTGEELKPRNGQKVVLFDAVVHAPKSASILGLVDDRVASAHRMATKHFMYDMERLAAVHRNGETVPTGNLLMAAYEHRLSRAQDIHLHTHVVTVNLTYNAAEGRWMALRASPIFYERHALTENYRTTLAQRLERIGYGISDKPMTGFEIAGVSAETIQKYSQRSAEIMERLAEKDKRINEKNVAWWTREGKDLSLSPAEAKEAQLARLTPAEHTQLVDLKERALERQSLHERVAPTPETETPKERRKLSLRDGVHSEPDLQHEQWNYGETPSYRAGYKVRP